MAETSRTALVAGASGLVGGEVLERLLASPAYGQVKTIGRSLLDREHPKLDQRVVGFDWLEREREFLAADDAFCCLGTTLKKAGSPDAFRRVDHDYVVTFARLAHERGAERMLLVSAVGADPDASNFYLRVKGRAERSIDRLGFTALHIFRPSILLGARDESRPGERAAVLATRLFGWVLAGPLARYRGVRPATLARAMLTAAVRGAPGRHVYTYRDVEQLAEES